MIRMDRHRVYVQEENINAFSQSIPYKCGPPPPPPKKKKRKVFPSSWLSSFDLHGFDEKQGSMHLMFHCNETID